MATKKRGGVEPYPDGLRTKAEDIEAGEQREETNSGHSKRQAITLGRKLQGRMHGDGWVLRVWQNLGWHYAVYRGALALHVHSGPGWLEYTTLLDDAPPAAGEFPLGGAPIFSMPAPRGFTNPNIAVKAQLNYAQQVIVRLAAAAASGCDTGAPKVKRAGPR